MNRHDKGKFDKVAVAMLIVIVALVAGFIVLLVLQGGQ